jgi:predicted dehydrogenase
VHTIDLLLWLFGPARRVFARTATALHAIEVEDTAVAVVEFANGALGTIEATTAAYPGYSRRIELTGSEGTVILDGDRLSAVDLRTAGGAVGVGGSSGPTAAPTASASSPIVADASAHQRVIEDFIRAMTTRTAPACDGRDGRRSVALIDAIYESARTDRPVELP